MKTANGKSKTAPAIRCAIYTRKSTEEGLEQEFNSLDAQREAGEAFIKSQQHEGWTCSSTRYDDGGFTGGNMDRPALRRLLADIEAGLIDCVVVYKVDRLSRSLLDFARMMQTFETHEIAFVSVTQQFNTATSMGRLVLNVLLSFAQFEREIISERTRDKIAATRRKGKWAGGHPILGYDVDPQNFRLKVNETEALRVRAIFELYLEHGSLLPVVHELDRRGWQNKRWTTRKEKSRGGLSFTKTSLYRLLTNVAYTGRIRYKSEVHVGEHPAILDAAVWQRTQTLLARNGRTGGAPVRNRFGALLKGLIRCAGCRCAMTPSHTTRNGNKRYRYYTCVNAQKKGWQACAAKSVPAGPIEEIVVRQIQGIGRDAALRAEVLDQLRRREASRREELEAERRGQEQELRRTQREMTALSGRLRADEASGPLIGRLAELQSSLDAIRERLADISGRLSSSENRRLEDNEAEQTLEQFEPVWSALTPREQARLLDLLVEAVEYDGANQTISITFRPTGLHALADENAFKEKSA